MTHTLLIGLHALTATVALVAGALAFTGRRRWLPWHLPDLVAMELTLAGAIAVEWATLDTTLRIVFGALLGLGVVVVARGVEAVVRRPRGDEEPGPRYRAALGVTVVALVDAFLVVTVLDLGGPAWALVVTGVVVAVAGHLVLGRRLRRRTRAPVAA